MNTFSLKRIAILKATMYGKLFSTLHVNVIASSSTTHPKTKMEERSTSETTQILLLSISGFINWIITWNHKAEIIVLSFDCENETTTEQIIYAFY